MKVTVEASSMSSSVPVGDGLNPIRLYLDSNFESAVFLMALKRLYGEAEDPWLNERSRRHATRGAADMLSLLMAQVMQVQELPPSLIEIMPPHSTLQHLPSELRLVFKFDFKLEHNVMKERIKVDFYELLLKP